MSCEVTNFVDQSTMDKMFDDHGTICFQKFTKVYSYGYFPTALFYN